MRTRLLCLAVLGCTTVLAQPAAAQVQPAGTGEPLYTNSAQNTQFFEWPAQPQGIDAYQVQYRHYVNNAETASPTYNYGTGAGNTWADWSGVAALQHGAQYGICAQGRYSFTNDPLFFPDGMSSCGNGDLLGRRSHTTIDRSKPSAVIALAGGAQFTRDAKIPLKVDFSDDVAGPFPANFICFQYGGGPTGLCDNAQGFVYGYNPACSVPTSGGKSTRFDCTADYGSGATPAPDGPVWACVRAADAAIPDNPSNANQSGSADKANLSDPSCDGVVLDRTAPTAAIAASATAVKVGDLVTFQAQAADAMSGVSGQSAWTWGDNTAGSGGASASHTFTQAGTYEVRLTVADNAGNTATVVKVVTVSAPAGGTTTPGGGTPTPGGGTPTPGAGAPIPGGGTPAAGGGSPTAPGGGAAAPKLTLSAPRKLAVKARAVRVALTAEAAGRVQLALLRGGRIVSRGGVAVSAGTSSYALKLPKGTKAGRYAIKATYTPASGAVRTAARTITLTGKPAARRARAASRPGGTVGRGPVALPDGAFHGKRPARTFDVR